MRTLKYFLVVGLLIAFGLTACSDASAAPALQNSQDNAAARTISVNGTGRITLTPDIARIFIGVQTEDERAKKAVTDNSVQAQEVIDTLQGFDIAEEDIRTTNFSIYPRRNFDRNGRPTTTTFIVQNTVQVTVRDLDKIGEILEAVVQVGANDISGIQFDVADSAAASEEALEAAVQDARKRAEVLAQAADVDLGEVRSINTFVGGGIPFPVGGRVAFDVAEAAEVPISPGQMEISVEVTVVYAIQ